MKRVQQIALVIGGAVLALVLDFAVGGWWSHAVGKTPGMIASDILIHPVLGGDQPASFAAAGDKALVQITMDWLFWFVVVCLTYFLFKRICQGKATGRLNA